MDFLSRTKIRGCLKRKKGSHLRGKYTTDTGKIPLRKCNITLTFIAIALMFMKVLVVHPNEVVVASIKAHWGQWTIHTALSGLDGFIACRFEYFDLIVCGLDLPVITGIELVRSIRNISENRETPVLFLADGKETEEHFRLIHKIKANILTLDRMKEIDFSFLNTMKITVLPIPFG